MLGWTGCKGVEVDCDCKGVLVWSVDVGCMLVWTMGVKVCCKGVLGWTVVDVRVLGWAVDVSVC